MHNTITIAELSVLTAKFPAMRGEDIAAIMGGARYYANDVNGEPTRVSLDKDGPYTFAYASADEVILNDEWACEMLADSTDGFREPANALADAQYAFKLALRESLSGHPVSSVISPAGDADFA